MEEFHTAARVSVDPATSTADLLVGHAERTPELVLLRRRDGDGWLDRTAAEVRAEVVAVARGLVAARFDPGDRIAIMSRTRYEWTVLDFAAWYAGLVPVPVYETSSPSQVEWILADSGARGVAVENEELAGVVARVRPNLPGLRHVWTFESGGLDELAGAGDRVPLEAVEARRDALTVEDLATIIYTSGTTGQPKGVELTHGNFVALSLNAIDRLHVILEDPGVSTLLFLPLAHVFARFIEVLAIAAGATLGHASDVKSLVADLGTFRPTFLLAVPRVFEKVYNSAEQKATAAGRAKIFHRAARTAIAYSRALDAGRPGPWLRLQHRVADLLVLHKLRAALGGRVRWAISGGAPLGERLGHFFRGVGLTVLEGYGLTETTAPASVNVPERVKIGTVGPPLPGTGLRIAEDGEVLVRGIPVFRGYHGAPLATAEAFTGDWFHTGDLGELDDDGYLRITGRKKEIIVTAAGKNVAPTVLEDRVRSHPLVSQCVVVGDARPYVGALITLDAEMLPLWLGARNREALDLAAAATDPDVRAALDRAVARANEAVSRAESIRTYVVLDTDFTVANGYLTPSLKVKRHLVLRDFADTIDDLYARSRPAADR
jgi:long-chain acyl-CoA synthetase